MKNILVAIFLSIVTPGLSQTIKYQKTFRDAQSIASAQNKLIFVHINTSGNYNKNFKSGLDAPEVAAKFNSNFINYSTTPADSASYRLIKKYQVKFYPTYLFVDKSGSLIYRDDKNSSSAQRYINMADSAIKQASSGENLSNYDIIYNSGKLDSAFLRKYILLRQRMGINDNALLIDQYVDYLKIRSLSNYQEILFILKSGPFAYGKAYSVAYLNKKIADSIYKTEPLAARIAINKNIIDNTYYTAISRKDFTMASNASNFLRATYQNNTLRPDYYMAAKASTQTLLNYYQAVKDTANYLQQAQYFYDNYYMRISADSAQRLLAKQRNLYTKSLNGKPSISADSLKKLQATHTGQLINMNFSTIATQQDAAAVLNNAAYQVYLTGTHNANYLLKAITWARRSLELRPSAATHDTMAHLLYRYGFYADCSKNS